MRKGDLLHLDNSSVYKVPEEAAIRCSGVTCKAQIIERLKYFVSNDAFDITGFGDKQLESLYNLGLVKQIPDIFTLDEKLENFNLSKLGGWGISNLLNSINIRRTITLGKFISSLGIRLVGPHAAKLMANHYKSYENWYEAIAQLPYGSEELMSIIGIGEDTITSLEEFFSDEDNVKIVNDLAYQLEIEPVSANTSNSPLSGKTVVFTGTLSTIERNKAQAKAESVGAIVSSSVSHKTHFVIVGWVKV